ncbi:hypothetical protein [Nocardia sp. NPDC049149]|uniref:hypothetical protein n=1 Tax=Nocardia sp. NPDC049149 TaxID=3364315 RepID=UPI0037157DE4
MSAPITLDIEVSSPAAVELEIETPAVEVTPDPDGAQVIVVATPGPQGPAGPSGAGTGVFNETPSGTQNGINAVFTLANEPQAGSTTVYRNGLREVLGTGYTVTGSAITFTTPPLLSDVLTVDYLLEG